MYLQIDGIAAYAYSGGRTFDAKRPTVLFIHGAQHDHSVWILQSRYLAHHGYSVLAVDLPGHGRSAGPPLTSIESAAEWIGKLLSSTDVKQCALIGHSMGSLIALEACARFPDSVSQLVLVSSAYPMKVSDALLGATRDNEPRAMDMINLWSHGTAWGGFSHKPGNPGPGFNIVWSNLELMKRQVPGTLENDFVACDRYVGGEAAADKVTCPALYLAGDRDAMTPTKSGQALAARITGCRVRIIPGAGHALMAEAPDAVLDSIASFLAAKLEAA